MPILNFALILAFAFSGLFAGAFLAYNSPEEMKTGRKHFPLMQKIILVVISLIAIKSLEFTTAISLVLYAAAILFFSLVKAKTTYTYPLLGLVLTYFYTEPVFLSLTALAFLYGFPSGSLFVTESKNNRAKTLAKMALANSLFFVAPLIAYPLIYL